MKKSKDEVKIKNLKTALSDAQMKKQAAYELLGKVISGISFEDYKAILEPTIVDEYLQRSKIVESLLQQIELEENGEEVSEKASKKEITLEEYNTMDPAIVDELLRRGKIVEELLQQIKLEENSEEVSKKEKIENLKSALSDAQMKRQEAYKVWEKAFNSIIERSNQAEGEKKEINKEETWKARLETGDKLPEATEKHEIMKERSKFSIIGSSVKVLIDRGIQFLNWIKSLFSDKAKQKVVDKKFDSTTPENPSEQSNKAPYDFGLGKGEKKQVEASNQNLNSDPLHTKILHKKTSSKIEDNDNKSNGFKI